jgi:hypothetical protein
MSSEQKTVEPEYDIFVSFREADAAFRDVLVRVLEAEGYVVAHQAMLVGKHHADDAAYHIQRSQVVIFVLNPIGFTNRENLGGFQFKELQAYEQVLVGNPRVGVACLLMQERDPETDEWGPDWSGYPESKRSLEHTPATVFVRDRTAAGTWKRDLLKRLRQIFLDEALGLELIVDREKRQEREAEDQRKREREAEKLRKQTAEAERVTRDEEEKSAAESRTPMEIILADLRSTPQSARTAPLKPLPEALADYLFEWADDWAAGRVPSPGEQSDQVASRQASPFAHAAPFFIELDARLRTQEVDRPNGDGGGRTTASANTLQPSLKMMLQPLDDDHFTVVEADSGVGKTTSIATLAAALAALQNPDARRRVRVSANPDEFLKLVESYLPAGAPPPTPIVFRCTDCAPHLGADGEEAGGESMLAWIAHSLLRDHVLASHLKAAMSKQPFIIIADAFDELDVASGDKLISVLQALQIRIAKAGGILKVVVASRAPFERLLAYGSCIELQPFDEKQYEAFVARFAAGASASFGPNMRRYGSDARVREILSKPLFLRAACQLANEGRRNRIGSKVDLCEAVVDNLLTSLVRKFNARDEAAARRLLRFGWERLAFEVMRDSLRGTADLQALVEAILRERPAEMDLLGLDPIRHREQLIEILCDNSAFAVQTEAPPVRFLHPLFKEYFAAHHLCERHLSTPSEFFAFIGEQKVKKWAHVFPFLLGVAPAKGKRPECASFLIGILETASSSNNDVTRKERLGLALDAAEDASDAFTSDGEAEFIRLATNLLRQGTGRMDLSERAKRFRQIGRVVGSSHSAEDNYDAIRDHLGALLPDWRPFVDAPVAFPDGASGTITRIATSTVMVAQYALFLASDDRNRPDFWRMTPREPREFMAVANDKATDGSGATLGGWERQLRNPTAPVTSLSWYESAAYCLWLTHQLIEQGELNDGEQVRMFTSEEWKVLCEATAAPGKTYPWGDDPPGKRNKARANWRGSDLDSASALGVFAPLANGLYDLGSNVQSWALPSDMEWGMQPQRSKVPPVRAPVLGGSWIVGENLMRIGRARVTNSMNSRSRGVGLWIAVATV